MAKKSTKELSDEEREQIIKNMRDATMNKLEEMQQIHKNQMLGAAQELHIMYESYQMAGFTKKESMELVKALIAAGMNASIPKK